MKLILVFLALFAPQNSFALPDSIWAVPFYRSISSPFASGEAHLRDLVRGQVANVQINQFEIKADRDTLWIDAGRIARDQDLSSNEPADFGKALLLTESFLRTGPTWKSPGMTPVSAKQVFEIESIQGDWISVKSTDGSKAGYLHNSQVLLRADFATFVMVGGRWQPVSYRQGAQVVLSSKESVALSDIRGFLTQSDKGIVIDSTEESPLKIKQHVTILQSKFDTWMESSLPGHGTVFWKKDSQKTVLPTLLGLTTDTILKREIFSVAVHPKNPNIAMVSAAGIFMTTDGRSWKKLTTLGATNYPVFISQQGYFFVGDRVSTDGGKTFSPYFRWQDLTSALPKANSEYGSLKILGYSMDTKDRLTLEVGYGTQKVKLSRKFSKNFIDRWEPL